MYFRTPCLLSCLFIVVSRSSEDAVSISQDESLKNLTTSLPDSSYSELTTLSPPSTEIKLANDSSGQGTNGTDNRQPESKYGGLIDETKKCLNDDFRSKAWDSLNKCVMDGCFGCHNKPCPFCVDKQTKCVEAFKLPIEYIIDVGIKAIAGYPIENYRFSSDEQLPLCEATENASLTNQTVEEPNSAPTATTEVPKPESSTESPTTEASRSDDSNSKNATGNQERIELNPSADSNSSKENKAKTNEK